MIINDSPFSSPKILSLDEYSKQNAWGLYTSIDIFNCDEEIIKSEDKIRNFTKELCELLDVKRYGEPMMILFGGDPPDPKIYGWSMAQMIETSLVSGHFIQAPRHAYVDIFSCKYYDAKKAIKFTLNFFKGTSFDYGYHVRGDSNAIKADSVNKYLF